MDLLASGSPAKQIQLLPMGVFHGRDGRGPWTLRDKAHADQVIAATRQTLGKLDLAVDYDHQTMFAAKAGVGGVAPASGWIKADSLQARADGIWGDVEWTAPAAAKLQDKEYRYLSPVFGHTPDGQVTRIFNAALTNNPAIEELAAVAAVQEQEDPMKFAGIAKALGLGEDATEAQVTAAIDQLKARHDAAAGELKATASALGLADTAKGEEIVAAAKSAGTPDPSKFVPLQMFKDLQTEVTTLKGGQAEDKAVAAVDQATAAGKVTPGQRDWALGYARKDLAGFETYVAAAVAVIDPTKASKDPKDLSAVTLTDEDKAICAALGVTEADFLETKKKEA